MKKQSLNALAASYRADLLYYIERAKLGKCPPHWQAYCFGEIAAAKGTDAYPEDGDALLDELRGLDLISMMLYHGMWDVVFLFGVAQKWYTGRPGFVWQQSICWVFILLSGFCLPLGHRPLRRGLIVSGAGVLVTVVTLLFMPEDRVFDA